MDIIRKYWKQFADWAIGSEDKLLRKAHLKLTLYYILLIAVIFGIYSLFLYFSLRKNIHENFTDETEVVRIVMIDRAVDGLERSLLSIDLTVLVLGSVFGYILAKNTLKPVRKAFFLQQRFSADASHELRTPLTIMRTDSEVLLRSKHSTVRDMRLLAERNLEEINRMSKIVEDLLMLARGGKIGKTHYGKVNLGKTVRKLAVKMQKPAQNKNIVINLDRVEDGKVFGNRTAIEQAILNLLQNAINYTPLGGNISVAVRSGNKYMTMLIQDTGIGISKKDLSRIFERFYKADSARSMKSEGAGLGLAIVKEIIDKHQGKIKISSRRGKGTGVMIWLPKAVD